VTAIPFFWECKMLIITSLSLTHTHTHTRTGYWFLRMISSTWAVRKSVGVRIFHCRSLYISVQSYKIFMPFCALKRDQFLKINNSCYAEDLKNISLREKFYVSSHDQCVWTETKSRSGVGTQRISEQQTPTVLFTCITVHRSFAFEEPESQKLLEMCRRVDTRASTGRDRACYPKTWKIFF